MEVYGQLRRESLEYMTLLWSLTETPGGSNTYKDKAVTQSPRQLSIVEERQLADAFAFLASWKDDPDKIMAACVEERHLLNAGITIRVASNTGDPSGIVGKLQGLATTMMKASHRNASRSGLQQNVLRQVVEMCVDRILSRLRSRHARRTRRTTGKPCLPPQLLRAANQCAISATGKKSKAAARQVVQQAETMVKIFTLVETSLEGEPRTLRLMELLECASQCDITTLINVLPFAQSIDPSVKRYLPNAISKLARYFEISQYLINAARTKRHSLFHNINIVAVRHPSFQPQHLQGPFRPFDELLRKAGCQKHRRIPTLRTSESQYISRFSDPRATWKVHAEIQILVFYEMEPQPVLPRIISASKLACFSCDLFIRIHGKFCVPGTHGKIYNTWVLPELFGQDSPVYVRLLPAIQSYISELRLISKSKVMSRNTRRSPPTESTVFPLEPWSSNSTIRQASNLSLAVRGHVDSHHQPLAVNSGTSLCSFLRSKETVLPETTATANSSKIEVLQSKCYEHDVKTVRGITASSFDILCSQNALEFCIISGVTTLVQADLLHLFLSVEQEFGNAMGDRDASKLKAFPLRLEDITKSKRKEEALEHRYPVIDIESLEVDRDYKIPVGAAASQKMMVIRNSTQQFLLSFIQPDLVVAENCG